MKALNPLRRIPDIQEVRNCAAGRLRPQHRGCPAVGRGPDRVGLGHDRVQERLGTGVRRDGERVERVVAGGAARRVVDGRAVAACESSTGRAGAASESSAERAATAGGLVLQDPPERGARLARRLELRAADVHVERVGGVGVGEPARRAQPGQHVGGRAAGQRRAGAGEHAGAEPRAAERDPARRG